MKSVLKKALKYISEDEYRFLINANVFHRYDKMPDEEYIKRIFKIKMGYELDLDHPKTFNEKLQWLKLNDRKPIYTKLVDKHQAKKHVADTVGNEYVIPSLGVWDNIEDIDFNTLPNQFVLKCTHNSGKGMYVCKDKSHMDITQVKQNLQKGLAENYYLTLREWPYKDVPRRIIAEKYMEDTCIGKLLDYKFYCFNGEPKFLYVGDTTFVNGNKSELLLTFFDLDWNIAPFYRKDHKQIPWDVEKPEGFSDMVNIVRILSKGLPFVRLDLYWINKRIYFSEYTFHPGGGFGKFYPERWEEEIGSWIELPNNL